MKLIQMDVPADLCQGSLDEALEEIVKNGFEIKTYFLIVGQEDRNTLGELSGMFFQANVIDPFPDSAWMIIDCKGRFTFYSEGT